MEWKAVESSQIEAVGYDAATETMAVKFKPTKKQAEENCEGSTYHYANVEPETFAALLAAESVGSYFGKVIKCNPTKYPYVQVN